MLYLITVYQWKTFWIPQLSGVHIYGGCLLIKDASQLLIGADGPFRFPPCSQRFQSAFVFRALISICSVLKLPSENMVVEESLLSSIFLFPCEPQSKHLCYFNERSC